MKPRPCPSRYDCPPGHSAVIKDGFIYVVGPSQTLQRYDVAKDAWSLLSQGQYPFFYVRSFLPRLVMKENRLFSYGDFDAPVETIIIDDDTPFNRREAVETKVEINVEQVCCSLKGKTMATEVGDGILCATSERKGWNKFRQSVILMDDGVQPLESFTLISNSWTSHLMFPIYATKLARDFKPLP